MYVGPRMNVEILMIQSRDKSQNWYHKDNVARLIQLATRGPHPVRNQPAKLSVNSLPGSFLFVLRIFKNPDIYLVYAFEVTELQIPP